MQKRVTKTAKPLWYPQTVQAYEDVGNLVHQHSHQSTSAFVKSTLRIAHEFELCVERSPSAILSGANHFALPTCCADF
jgi:hypothetical protein